MAQKWGVLKAFLYSQLDFKSDALKHLGIVNPITSSSSGSGLNLTFLTNTISKALNNRTRDPDFQDFYDYICLYKDRIQFALRVSNRILRETEDAQKYTREMPSYIRKLAELEQNADSFNNQNQATISNNASMKIFKTDANLKNSLEKFETTITNCGESYTEIIKYLKFNLIHYLELQERITSEIFTTLDNRDKVQFDLQSLQEDSNKSKLHQSQLQYNSNYGADDQMEKARMAHQIQSLDNRVGSYQKSKEEADSVVRNEMNFWKNEKTDGLKKRLAEMSLQNVKVLTGQLDEYEKLLEALG